MDQAMLRQTNNKANDCLKDRLWILQLLYLDTAKGIKTASIIEKEISCALTLYERNLNHEGTARI